MLSDEEFSSSSEEYNFDESASDYSDESKPKLIIRFKKSKTVKTVKTSSRD